LKKIHIPRQWKVSYVIKSKLNNN